MPPKNTSKRTYSILILIIVFGMFARLYRFGIEPAGLNPDEAFAGYEAWAILNYGIDSAGYHNPVYLTAWGSGMNALESYLMMPFIALFGLHNWVIRLPQLIVAFFSLIALFGTVKKISGDKVALIAMFIMAICPWHIILSRWALESNLAPGFVLFGLYFFICGLENPKFLMLSAIMYGLSLYAYATIWISVPFILLFQIIYCAAFKRISLNRYTVSSVCILFLLATPLVLFLAVNKGYIDAIQLSFISIPKIESLRDNEVGLANFWSSFKNIVAVIGYGTDGILWNSPEKFGLLYRFSLPFTLAGGVVSLAGLIKSIKSRSFSSQFFMLIWFLFAFVQGVLLNPNATRINIIFIPLLFFTAIGIEWFIRITHPVLLAAIVSAFLILYIQFEFYYFGDYCKSLSGYFCYGLKDAFEKAGERGSTVFIDPEIPKSYILYYWQIPPANNVDSKSSPDHSIMSPGRTVYREIAPSGNETDSSFIMTYPTYTCFSDYFEEQHCSIEQRGNYVVVFEEVKHEQPTILS